MAKLKERNLAYIYYVEHGKTFKESARLAGVTEKTVGKWAEEFGWKNKRIAQTNSKNSQIRNIKEILSLFAEEQLDLARQLKDANTNDDKEEVLNIRSQMASIGDQVSKWNKTLENINKANKITLEVYLNVMESIFKSVQVHSPKLFSDLLDFQEEHVHEISVKLG